MENILLSEITAEKIKNIWKIFQEIWNVPCLTILSKSLKRENQFFYMRLNIDEDWGPKTCPVKWYVFFIFNCFTRFEFSQRSPANICSSWFLWFFWREDITTAAITFYLVLWYEISCPREKICQSFWFQTTSMFHDILRFRWIFGSFQTTWSSTISWYQ